MRGAKPVEFTSKNSVEASLHTYITPVRELDIEEVVFFVLFCVLRVCGCLFIFNASPLFLLEWHSSRAVHERDIFPYLITSRDTGGA